MENSELNRKNTTNMCVFFLSVFFSVEDVMTGKRIYITASTARDHTHKLWQNEGKRVFETSQKQLQVSK